MLEVVGRTLQAAVSLIDVRAKLLLHDAERATAALLLKAGAGICIGLAVLAGLTAGMIALAPIWGWAGAVGAAAGALLVVGLIAWAIAASVKQPKADPVAEDLELQAARLRAQLNPPEVKVLPSSSTGASTSRSAPRIDDPLRAVQQLIKDPAMIASAVFAVVAVLGPLRALRTAAKVAAAASAARKLANVVQESTARRS